MPSKVEARVAEHDRRIAQHDREIAAIRKLLSQGARMLVKLEAAQVRTERSLDRLEAAQLRTEQSLDRFIRSLERGGGNGHSKRPV